MKLQVINILIFLSIVGSQAFAQKPQTQDKQFTTSSVYALNSWQVVLARISQSMTSKESSSSDTHSFIEKKMTGENFGLYFEVIKNGNDYFEWLANIGYEIFSVSGKDSAGYCPSNSSENCIVDINYISLGVMPRLKLVYDKFLFWSGVNLNIKQPLTKKATAVLENDIQTTSTYGLALGLTLFAGEKLIIPIDLQQQFFLKSDSVEAQLILLKVGIGRSF